MAAQANRRIVDQPTVGPDDSMGQALQRVGQVGMEVATRIQASETDQQLVKAERETRVRLDRLKLDLEADAETPDAAIPKRWQQESEAIIKEMAGTISSEKARNLWTERAKGWQGDGENWSVGLSRKRQVDKVRAGHITAASELDTQAGDLSISSETYAQSIEGARAALKRDLERGMLDPESVARQEAALDQMGLKDRTVRWTSNIDALVEQGRVAEAQAVFDTGAKDVDPQTREKVRAGLQQSKQEFAVLERGDDIWAKSKGDYGKAIELAGKITDAPLRTKVEERINKMAAQAKAAEDARQDGLEKTMWSHVEKGGTIMNAPPSLRASIDPDRLGSIRAFENARDAEGGMNASQKAAWRDRSADSKAAFDWFASQNPAAFMGKKSEWPVQYQEAYAGMTPDDQRAVAAKQSDMIVTGTKADAVDKIMQDVKNEAQRFAPSLMASGKDNDQQRMIFEGILYRNSRLLSLGQGGVGITPEQSRKVVLQSLAEYDTKKYGAGVNVALNFDAELYRRVTAAQTAKLGRAPTNEEALAAYNAVAGN